MLRSLLLLAALAASCGAETLPVNGGFEDGLAGWSPLWTREAGAGTLALDAQEAHGGKNSARVEHRGTKDWSLDAKDRLDVASGDLIELSAWVKMATDTGAAIVLCVSTWDGQGRVQQWNYGAVDVEKTTDWKLLRTRFLVPPGIAQIQARFIGAGPARTWIDDVSLSRQPGIAQLRRPGLPATLSAGNPVLNVTLDTAAATLNVADRRTGEAFQQRFPPGVAVLDATPDGDGRLRLTLLHVDSGLRIETVLALDPALPEFTVELSAQGELPGSLRFPGAFLSKPGQSLIVPLNEGISYPVDDPAIEPMNLVAYGGHGLCMAFWGLTDGDRGQMAILETPDDASIRIDRYDGRLDVAPEWEAQKGQFGYARRLRYVFFDHGGYVAMAKRYRAYAQRIGLFKTLAEKRRENPNVDLLVGAVNVWCWDPNPVPLAKEMQAAGIGRILWSNAQSPENLRALNALGILTSRYDIYGDAQDPATYPTLKYVHPDWPAGAWPGDLVLDPDGHPARGWAVETKDGRLQPGGVVNDVATLTYARQRIPAELETHPYRCRFIDTTTASAWREDYSPAHPMTRTQSREARMSLLRFVSEECRLVAGSETGHDAAVPFVDYFEGMLSLTPYRVPDSGRDMERVWNDVPANVAKFQVGQAYRLPLWELVYHDCVVAHWYWGDYSNKLPALWDKRDLFNVLYGTPPLFMFERNGWEKDKARFVRSYQDVAPVARATGYSEMTDHRYLTPDRDVQRSTFANGTAVTVNFGAKPYSLSDGSSLAPLGFRVDGAPRAP